MSNNKGYWGTKYKDVLSGTLVLSAISIALSALLLCLENYFISDNSNFYAFLSFLVSVYIIVIYCINYYLLIKKYSFVGSVKKFLYGFIPCVTAVIIAVFAVVK